MKSLLAQFNAMHRDWPQFQASLGLGPQSVIWFGDLKGLERQFHVSIEYGLPVSGRNDTYRLMPVVRVLRPSLILNYNAEEEAPLPHVYFESPDPRLSPLCLFDPKADEWDSSMLISRTTVGWTVRWLAAYEFWEMTGRWIGGGRHDEYGAAKGEDHAA
ncbi:hypothetical protein [Roseibium sp.]|uniref:hypothetical protein n=1 Tax=Roseibium sp. TaxID=1936156 RepID=UPI003BAA5C76